jgi:hypothetical protein
MLGLSRVPHANIHVLPTLEVQSNLREEGRFGGFDPGKTHPIPENVRPNSCPMCFELIYLSRFLRSECVPIC